MNLYKSYNVQNFIKNFTSSQKSICEFEVVWTSLLCQHFYVMLLVAPTHSHPSKDFYVYVLPNMTYV